MFELNNTKATTKVVRYIDLVIIKKKARSGKGKGKGRFGEDVRGERILREAEDDVVDMGFGVEEGCPEHACSLIQYFQIVYNQCPEASKKLTITEYGLNILRIV